MKDVLIQISNASHLLAAVTGIFCWKYLSGFARIIVCQVVISAITEAVGMWLTSAGENNTWLYNIYMLPEFILIMIAGYKICPSASKKKILVIKLSVYITVWSITMIFFNTGYLLTYMYIIGALMIVFFYLLQLTQMLHDEVKDNNALLVLYSILIYFSGVIPMTGFQNYIFQNDRNAMVYLIIIIVVLNIMRQCPPPSVKE